ncbi:MAG TPA: hypothetical protein VF082_04195, partial [Jiangellaceae bacterium]
MDAAEVDAIGRATAAAAPALEALERHDRASLLDGLAGALEDARTAIVATADRETSLGDGRLSQELTRTCYQLRLFGEVLREGSYLEATIDLPAATPMGPRPDLRRMLVPLGPVAHGMPAGTLGLVEGLRAGAALVRHPAIAAVGFTGS